MQMSDGLLRVFWPYDLPRSSSPGVIVGWRNSELDLFVLAVLEDVEVCAQAFEDPRLKY
jgi:phosphatidylinositol glycan class Q protein